METLPYPTGSVTPRAFKALSPCPLRGEPTLSEAKPATPNEPRPAPSEELPWFSPDHLRTMLACDVDTFLPRHFHQTFKSPLRRECALGKRLELQDCTYRAVWGDPVRVTKGMIVIGLMWVYTTKQSEPGGLFLRVRSRITLLGNQEKGVVTKVEA